MKPSLFVGVNALKAFTIEMRLPQIYRIDSVLVIFQAWERVILKLLKAVGKKNFSIIVIIKINNVQINRICRNIWHNKNISVLLNQYH